MLMHTSGILVMTPDSAMVLTGKQAIDYSGGVSAEDNLGIGGYARIMGPNGEAQYFAPTIAARRRRAVRALPPDLPGTRRAVAAPAADRRSGRSRRAHATRTGPRAPSSRPSARSSPTPTNRERKKPFDIRTVIAAVVDADHESLERWPEMAEAETAVVCDARLGGYAVTVLGVESRPLPRHGMTPADGPAQWSAGTLFPLSSKKVARAINAANGKRPVVMLANLSGFDGSPESLRRLQLEYGAEIGRALVNFDGPFVLCVVSRYHGGAFVVFSATLNDDMEVLAVEGSFASVIGGAPAAAVVFTREVDERTRADERVQALERALARRRGTRGRPAPRRARHRCSSRAHREARRGGRRVRRDPQRRAGPSRRFGASHHRRRRSPARADRRRRAGHRPRRCQALPPVNTCGTDRRARRPHPPGAGGGMGRRRAAGRRPGGTGAHGDRRPRGHRSRDPHAWRPNPVDAVVAYHPLLFRPAARLVPDRSPSGRAARLLRAGVAVDRHAQRLRRDAGGNVRRDGGRPRPRRRSRVRSDRRG